MPQTKKLDIISGPEPDDMAASLLQDFTINFFVVENADETSWQLEVTITMMRIKTTDQHTWIFEGRHKDPATNKDILVSGIIQSKPPCAGRLELLYP